MVNPGIGNPFPIFIVVCLTESSKITLFPFDLYLA